MASQISRIRKRIILFTSMVTAVAILFLLIVVPTLSDMTPQAARITRLNTVIFGPLVLIAIGAALWLYLRPISDLGYALEIGSTPTHELVHDARRIAINAPIFFFLFPMVLILMISLAFNLVGALVWAGYSFVEHMSATMSSITFAASIAIVMALFSRRWMRPVLLYTAHHDTVGLRLSIRTRLLVAILTVLVTAIVFPGVFAYARVSQLYREQIAATVHLDLNRALDTLPDNLAPAQILPYLAGRISAGVPYDLFLLLDDQGTTLERLVVREPSFSFDSEGWLAGRPDTIRQTNGYFVLAPLRLAGRAHWIAVGFSPYSLRTAMLDYSMGIFGVLAALTVGLAALVSHFLASDMILDVSDISVQLLEMARQDRAGVGVELPVLSRDEIGDLILAYNALQEQIEAQQEQAEQKQRQLTALQALSYKIGTIHNMDQLLHEIVRDIERTFGYHNVSVLLLDEEEQELYFAATGLSDVALRSRRFRVGQDGVVGHAAANREPMLINDVSACDYYIPDRTNTRSELAVPMVQEDRVIGVLNVSSERIGAFEESDLRIITALSNQLAIAIENTRLLTQVTTNATELERRARNLMILNNISLTLSTSLQMEELLATTLEQLTSLFEIGHGAVLLLDEEEGYGEFVVEHPDKGMRGKRIPIKDMPAVRRILASRQAVFITDAPRSEQLKALRDRLEAWDIRSMLLVPLTTKGSVEGIILLNAVGEQRYFTPDELGICQTVAAHVAVSIENVRLIEGLRQQADSLARMARDLAADRGQLDAILRNLADGLLVTDPQGRVLLFNPAFSFLFNLDARLKGLPTAQVVPDLPLQNMIAQAAHERAVQVQEARLPDGRYFQITAAGVHEGDRLIAVVMVLRDVTRERQLDVIKSDFISTVSHELRTPLTPVMGFARLIQKSFRRTIMPALRACEPARQERESPLLAAERIDQNLDILIAEVDQLRNLVDDVLFLADLDAGRIKWHMQTFDLQPILSNVIDGLQPQVQAKGLQLHLQSDDLPPVYGDPDRLERVIRNLIGNAIKFTAAGQITVYAQVIEQLEGQWLTTLYVRVPGNLPPGSYLLLAVRDTGPGISLQAQQTLFERFGQGMRDVLTEKPEGTGLGLALSKEIVGYHRGQIWVESEPGAGSLFAFLLPLSGENSLAQWEESAILPDRAPSLLVVEDEPAMRELLYHILYGAGYRTMIAADGQTALSMVHIHEPDLIVLDILAPDIGGLDLISALHADAATARIPIILLAALADQERAVELGADACFAKPLDQDAFTAAVARLLSRRTAGVN